MRQFMEESRVVFGLTLECGPRRHCYRVPRWDVGCPRVLLKRGGVRHSLNDCFRWFNRERRRKCLKRFQSFGLLQIEYGVVAKKSGPAFLDLPVCRLRLAGITLPEDNFSAVFTPADVPAKCQRLTECQPELRAVPSERQQENVDAAIRFLADQIGWRTSAPRLAP